MGRPMHGKACTLWCLSFNLDRLNHMTSLHFIVAAYVPANVSDLSYVCTSSTGLDYIQSPASLLLSTHALMSTPNM